jgi:glycosyltransferase involved in cell wall biosynthesis
MSKKNPTVSIITITQYKRAGCLKILKDIIKDQTYKNIIEWVLVEGSPTKEDSEKNEKHIQELISQNDLGFTINYLPYVEGLKLGALRNRGNNECKGEITVCMDDDDYYPETRVEHAVKSLVKSKAKIAGCSHIFIYDYFLEKLYQYKAITRVTENHSTNNCMAWKKDYLKNNKHDDDKSHAEESSFTKGFTEKMVQLDPLKTIVLSSHMGNTFNKRRLLTRGTTRTTEDFIEINEPLSKYIKESYYNRLRNEFYKEEKSPYDIVYFAGGFSILWNPNDMSLGGSEQAIVNLANEWSSMGKKVAVYGEVPDCQLNGVDYFNWTKFPFNHVYNTVILWRYFGASCGLPFPLKSNNIFLDLHDNFSAPLINLYKQYGKKINKVFLKSNYHKEEFENALEEKIDNFVIVPNGIRTENFKINKDNVERNKYRFCYCSCYTRGLIPILRHIWPFIYAHEPRAELHVYYGISQNIPDETKQIMRELLSQPGVMDHGRQPMEMVIREKYMSNFHLYITDSRAEIDCISIRESLVTGCIPLLSNLGLFKDRDGLHFKLERTDENYKNIASIILKLIEQSDNLEELRLKLKSSKTIMSWKEVADAWLNM